MVVNNLHEPSTKEISKPTSSPIAIPDFRHLNIMICLGWLHASIDSTTPCSTYGYEPIILVLRTVAAQCQSTTRNYFRPSCPICFSHFSMLGHWQFLKILRSTWSPLTSCCMNHQEAFILVVNLFRFRVFHWKAIEQYQTFHTFQFLDPSSGLIDTHALIHLQTSSVIAHGVLLYGLKDQSTQIHR